ncbi:MAG: hypothetical protein CL868_06475 [Cytophagaceae bacterium]|nr:hypothetical protein [Cytophagaceae bacterium]
MNVDNIDDLREFVITRRNELGLTQQGLSFTSCIDRSWINKLEKGKVSNLTFDRLNKLLYGLNARINISTYASACDRKNKPFF